VPAATSPAASTFSSRSCRSLPGSTPTGSPHFTKGITIGSGQCPVKKYNRWLRDLIIRGQAQPSQIVSHELSLDDAVQAYDQFDKRVEGWTKVLLHPGGTSVDS
jgi:threonine dehydrogenase-like Zn-dependent dehydrogenase